MLLSVSNIAWHKGDDPVFFRLLKEYGFGAIDVAPTKIWPDWGANADAVSAFKGRLAEQGLKAVGMQSIFFGTQGLNVFAASEQWLATKRHLRKVTALAQKLGVTRVVFGAPNNRDPGETVPAQVREIALRRMRRLGAIFAEKQAILCLEPVPATAGGKFLLTTRETAEFVREVGHAGIGLNLDAAFLSGEGVPIAESVRAFADVIAHVHASEPELGTFANPKADHVAIAAALRKIDYRGAVAIEMRGVDGAEEANLRTAMTVVRQHYGAA